MLETIKARLNDEATQRAVLRVGSGIAVIVASHLFASVLTQASEKGIDVLMAKLHPSNETSPAG